MKKPASNEVPTVDIDMTPMIDIVFQLITFFMVVINFDAADVDERVRMARSELARPPKVKPESELVLQIGFVRDKDGSVKAGPFLFYTGENITLDNFPARLKREKSIYRLSHPEGAIKTTVIIRADADCATGVVQKLIKMCQDEGYEKFSLKAMQPDA